MSLISWKPIGSAPKSGVILTEFGLVTYCVSPYLTAGWYMCAADECILKWNAAAHARVSPKFWSEFNPPLTVEQCDEMAKDASFAITCVEACEGMAEKQLKRGVLLQQAMFSCDQESELQTLREFAATIKDFVTTSPHDMGLHDTAVYALKKLGVQS